MLSLSIWRARIRVQIFLYYRDHPRERSRKDLLTLFLILLLSLLISNEAFHRYIDWHPTVKQIS